VNKNEITKHITSELLDCGVLLSSVMIDEEQIIDGEAYTEPTYYEIDPLEYAPLVKRELIHRRARGQLTHEEFKEAMETLEFEVNLEKERKEKSKAIADGVVALVTKITKERYVA